MSSLEPDPNGDIVLKCSDSKGNHIKSYRVSSKILQLASPVFTALLSPHFREGQDLLHKEHPEINLKDDDAESLGLLLDVLHFHGDRHSDSMNPEKLASISVISDKYDLGRAIGSRIEVWFRNVKPTTKRTMDNGFALLAAYMFNDSTKFQQLSKCAITGFNDEYLSEWRKEKSLSLLPEAVDRSIIAKSQDLVDRLEKMVQSEQLTLLHATERIIVARKFCVECQRVHPDNAKKCHPCHNSDLQPHYCTNASRITEYFKILHTYGLWPTVDYFKTQDFELLLRKISNAQEYARSHHANICSYSACCPLVMSFNRLYQEGNDLQCGVEGLCLLCIREGEGLEVHQKCIHRDSPQLQET